MILVFLEKGHRLSAETLAAGQELGSELNMRVAAVTLEPQDVDAQVDAIFSIESPHLARYTPDAYTAALEQIIRSQQPNYVLLPHTYTVRDFAPKLATRFDRVLVSDVIAMHANSGSLVAVRQLFQGKLNVDVRFSGTAPFFLSIQAGAYRADALKPGHAAVESFPVEIDPPATRPEEPFRDTARAVDLSTAEIIVSVGRGIQEKEKLGIVEQLAEALGAELAASRPICDNGWLPMERQVGSSGQTVAPKVYVAVGISGAIQHLVGMKGSKTVVAINKDPEAPIFEIADYGIVGDLFDVVPALTEEIRKARS